MDGTLDCVGDALSEQAKGRIAADNTMRTSEDRRRQRSKRALGVIALSRFGPTITVQSTWLRRQTPLSTSHRRRCSQRMTGPLTPAPAELPRTPAKWDVESRGSQPAHQCVKWRDQQGLTRGGGRRDQTPVRQSHDGSPRRSWSRFQCPSGGPSPPRGPVRRREPRNLHHPGRRFRSSGENRPPQPVAPAGSSSLFARATQRGRSNNTVARLDDLPSWV